MGGAGATAGAALGPAQGVTGGVLPVPGGGSNVEVTVPFT